MEPKTIRRIKETLVTPEEDERSRYAKKAESFLNGGPSGGGSISWGLIILGAFAVYALIELSIVLLKIFQ